MYEIIAIMCRKNARAKSTIHLFQALIFTTLGAILCCTAGLVIIRDWDNSSTNLINAYLQDYNDQMVAAGSFAVIAAAVYAVDTYFTNKYDWSSANYHRQWGGIGCLVLQKKKKKKKTLDQVWQNNILLLQFLYKSSSRFPVYNLRRVIFVMLPYRIVMYRATEINAVHKYRRNINIKISIKSLKIILK